MEEKCINCGKKIIDRYRDINKYNERIYCNDCVDKMWEDF